MDTFSSDGRKSAQERTRSARENISPYCGREHLEADTFILFRALMARGLAPLFAVAPPPAVCAPEGGSQESGGAAAEPVQPQTVILQMTERIMEALLRRADPMLHNTLVETHGIPPNVFLLKWMRLMFAANFRLGEVCELWGVFLQDAFVNGESQFPSLAEFFAVAMIIFKKAELVQGDQNECISMLMKYPQPDHFRFWWCVGCGVGLSKRS